MTEWKKKSCERTYKKECQKEHVGVTQHLPYNPGEWALKSD